MRFFAATRIAAAELFASEAPLSRSPADKRGNGRRQFAAIYSVLLVICQHVARKSRRAIIYRSNLNPAPELIN
jgi:hypothetical protein